MADAVSGKAAAVKRASPCLLVDDAARAAAHYRDVLGFCFDGLFGEPPSFAIVSRGDGDVMFQQTPAGAQAVRPNSQIVRGTCDIFVAVDDVRALAQELAAKGADILTPPVYRPVYDGHEMIVRDCDGRLICFNQTKVLPASVGRRDEGRYSPAKA